MNFIDSSTVQLYKFIVYYFVNTNIIQDSQKNQIKTKNILKGENN